MTRETTRANLEPGTKYTLKEWWDCTYLWSTPKSDSYMQYKDGIRVSFTRSHLIPKKLLKQERNIK